MHIQKQGPLQEGNCVFLWVNKVSETAINFFVQICRKRKEFVYGWNKMVHFAVYHSLVKFVSRLNFRNSLNCIINNFWHFKQNIERYEKSDEKIT